MTKSKTAKQIAHDELLRSVTEKATDAFWNVVVEHFPEAETGDLSPLTTFRFDQAAENAVAEWVWANVPSTANE
jgi:hypothetical protein